MQAGLVLDPVKLSCSKPVASSSGTGPTAMRTRRFFLSSGQNRRQYSLHRPAKDWPGCVGLSGLENAGMVDRQKWLPLVS